MSKKYFLIFACFASISNCIGQDYFGTWKLVLQPRDYFINSYPHNNEYINIYRKDSYKVLYINIDSSEKISGYESENYKIIDKSTKNLKKGLNKYYDTILSVKGDTLTVINAKNYVNIYYRIPKQLYDSLRYLVTPKWPAIDHNIGLLFTNTIDTIKKVFFDSRKHHIEECGLNYEPTHTTYFGSIVEIDSNNIYWMEDGFTVNYKSSYGSNYSSSQTNHYYGNYYGKIGASINSIRYFKIQSYNADIISEIGGGLIVSGIFTSLFLAPLVSINYHNFDFNSKRYYHWALAGLGIAGVGLTLNLTHQPRRIDILQPNETPAENKWRVQYYKK